MENNTKIAIGLAAAVVVGYIVYKSSKPKTQTASTPSKCTGEFVVECNDGSCDISNGIVRACLGKGGEKGSDLAEYTQKRLDCEQKYEGMLKFTSRQKVVISDEEAMRNKLSFISNCMKENII
jgi:hypothetical protein